MADLLPTVGHIPLPYVMGYDTRPLLTIKEKAAFLNEAADNNYYLFLEHDAYNEICTVKHTEKGVRLNNYINLQTYLIKNKIIMKILKPIFIAAVARIIFSGCKSISNIPVPTGWIITKYSCKKRNFNRRRNK